MAQPTTAPFGSWKSPISAELIATKTTRVDQIVVDGREVYWTELKPAEGGRYALMKKRPNEEPFEVLDSSFNVRTAAHEYGGGAFNVVDGFVYFSNFNDGRIYVRAQTGVTLPLTQEGQFRYADMTLDKKRGHLICVREDHTPGDREAVNDLISIKLDDREVKVLASGYDFYSSLRLSPDFSRLAWLAWNHPNMPWDGTELFVAEIQEDGSLRSPMKVAGGSEESIFQPEWSPDGTLYFVSDRSDWWNIYRLEQGGSEPVYEMEAEFGVPQWRFGLSTYSFESEQTIVCTCTQQGVWRLAVLNAENKTLEPITLPYTYYSEIRSVRNLTTFLGASPTEPPCVIQYSLPGKSYEVLYRPKGPVIDIGYLSVPIQIEFPTSGGWKSYAIYYPPKNRDFVPPPRERPPLIIISHGGPTSTTNSTLALEVQYWTSRGFAVADVNYRGSTGYGRRYRKRLYGQWGIVDVDDCVKCAEYLEKAGRVDGDRLIIRGGSAGGFTTLSALTFRNAFKAGASYFGISDLEALTLETHKFESHYLERLVGPYPQNQKLYRDRSPIYFTNKLSCPVIFFQGLDDKVVPPSQSEKMFNALKEKGIPVAYLAFEGERHGFLKSESIKRAREAELYFYSVVFGFPLQEVLEPVEVHNLRS
jgi:dipeptidyl aminopeptidase/acylaminoacyl peptidase